MPLENVIIRKAVPRDARDFARLTVLTAPDYFNVLLGGATSYLLESLFRHPVNIYSYEHTYVMEKDGKVAGMTSFYSYKDKNRAICFFLILLMKYMGARFLLIIPALIKFGSIFVQIRKGDLYSSNSAIYPDYRKAGLGKKLFELSALEGKKRGLKRVVVDVKADNLNAISLREKLGFRLEKELSVLRIKGKIFDYLRMVKEL